MATVVVAEVRGSTWLARVMGAMRTLATRPGYAAGAATAVIHGRWCRLKFRLLGRRVHVGRNLRVYGRLVVDGPGEVWIGDDAIVIGDATVRTHDPGAVLRIGDALEMGGAMIDCAREIVIGDRCQIAQSYIADTDSHSTHANRHDGAAPVRVAPVWIGDNVWVAQFACILPGARIGHDSVVSCASVCTRAYPDGVVLVGNPARPAARVPGSPSVLTLGEKP